MSCPEELLLFLLSKHFSQFSTRYRVSQNFSTPRQHHAWHVELIFWVKHTDIFAQWRKFAHINLLSPNYCPVPIGLRHVYK